MNQDLRSAWGCEAPSKPGPWGPAFRYDLGGTLVDRCPLALMRHPHTIRALQLYGQYRYGITPSKPTTSHYQETMHLIDCLTTEAEGWYSKELERQRGKGGGHGRV